MIGDSVESLDAGHGACYSSPSFISFFIFPWRESRSDDGTRIKAQ